MKATFISREKNDVKFTMEFTAEEFENAQIKAYQKAKDQFQIDGFRKGKAPRSIIEKHYGEGVFFEDAIDELFKEHYGKALGELELEVIDSPAAEFSKIAKGEGFTVTITVPCFPVVEVKDYKGVEIDKIEQEVKDEDVENEIKALQKRNARMILVERPAKEGDTVLLDYSGFVGDEQFEGGTAEGYKLKIGSGSFIPGFEEQMVGMNIGDERDINVTFPEDYHAENLAGKPVVFKVKVHAITEENVPELNDEFVQDISECSTVDEYTAYVRGDLEKRAAERAKNERTDLILQKVIDNAEVEIHGDIVSAEVDMQIDRFDKQLQSFGADLKSYLEYAHLSIEDMRKDYEQAAQRQLKSQYVMMAIIDAEKLEPTDEDFREVIAMSDTAKQQHWDDEKIDAELKDNRMKYAVSALYNAAVKMLVANAVVPAAAPAEEAPAAE